MIQKLLKFILVPILCFSTSILIVGCQSSATSSSSSPNTPIANATETKLVDAYLKAIDLVLNTSPELNNALKYLAIDTSVLINLDATSRSQLLEVLEQYNVEVLDCSFEALGEQGYLKDALFENGLFLKIEDTPVSNNQIQIIPSKWRSTTYAAGLSKVILTLQDNIWTVTEEGIPWLQ